jgi:hypothetical protein
VLNAKLDLPIAASASLISRGGFKVVIARRAMTTVQLA